MSKPLDIDILIVGPQDAGKTTLWAKLEAVIEEHCAPGTSVSCHSRLAPHSPLHRERFLVVPKRKR